MTLTDESHIVIGDTRPAVHLTRQGWGLLIAVLVSLFVIWPLIVWGVRWVA